MSKGFAVVLEITYSNYVGQGCAFISQVTIFASPLCSEFNLLLFSFNFFNESIIPYLYGRTVNVPPTPLRFRAI